VHAKFLKLTWLVFAVVLSSCTNGQEPVADVELNPQNFSAWRDFILPTQQELDFLKIPWRTTFKEGILDARESDLPVLLWTMNGHPLGCT
jgi:hypothetical protein